MFKRLYVKAPNGEAVLLGSVYYDGFGDSEFNLPIRGDVELQNKEVVSFDLTKLIRHEYGHVEMVWQIDYTGDRDLIIIEYEIDDETESGEKIFEWGNFDYRDDLESKVNMLNTLLETEFLTVLNNEELKMCFNLNKGAIVALKTYYDNQFKKNKKEEK